MAVATGDEYTHRYKKGDRVDLWVNKVRHFLCGFDFKNCKKMIKICNEYRMCGELYIMWVWLTMSPPQLIYNRFICAHHILLLLF